MGSEILLQRCGYFYGDRRYFFGDRDSSMEIKKLPWSLRFGSEDCENSEVES